MASIFSSFFNIVNPYSIIVAIFVGIMVGLIIYFLLENYKEKQRYRCEIGESSKKK